MVTLSSITTLHGSGGRPMGLRRAVVSRQAILGDCANLREHASAVLSRHRPARQACVVPLGRRARGTPSAADLAAAAVRRLLTQQPGLRADEVAALIYCHEAPDERLSESTVGRLQHEFELRAAHPFAISQAHNTALWVALDLALGLVEGPEQAQQVMLVASDKLVFDGPAADARRLVFDDVAAAALVGVDRARDAGSGHAAWAVEQVLLRQFDTPCDAHRPWPAADVAAFAAFGATVLRQAMADAALPPQAVQAVLACSADAAFIAGLLQGAGITPAQHRAAARYTHAAGLLTGLSNIGHKLPNTNLPINQILPSVLSAAHSVQADRPFPQFTNVTILSPTIGDSRYFAGYVRVSKRFTKGLNLNASYTRATFLDNSFEGGSTVGADGGTYSNAYNRRADWGPSANDIRHRVTISSVYELPLGPGKRFFNSGLKGTLIGGWTLGSVVVVQSGAPFTVTTNTNNTNAFSAGNQRADVLRNPVLPDGQQDVKRWFDITAFAQPAPYTFGNGARDNMRGPGTINVDASILRNFKIREVATLQFRGEFLNAPNHTNLGLPGAAFGSAAFGQINSAKPARVMQIGMKLRL